MNQEVQRVAVFVVNRMLYRSANDRDVFSSTVRHSRGPRNTLCLAVMLLWHRQSLSLFVRCGTCVACSVAATSPAIDAMRRLHMSGSGQFPTDCSPWTLPLPEVLCLTSDRRVKAGEWPGSGGVSRGKMSGDKCPGGTSPTLYERWLTHISRFLVADAAYIRLV